MSNEEKDPQTHAIMGAAMEAHRTMGQGFLEPVCQEALVLDYLKATGLRRGWLIKIGVSRLEIKRHVFYPPQCSSAGSVDTES